MSDDNKKYVFVGKSAEESKTLFNTIHDFRHFIFGVLCMRSEGIYAKMKAVVCLLKYQAPLATKACGVICWK